MSSNRRWTLKVKPPLHLRQWDSATFLYDPASGQSHYLNEACAEVIALLGDDSLSVDELYRRILESHETDEDVSFHAALSDMMLLLDRLGVVQSAP
jgi:PqqD family protein of HPr-rel-A system